MISNLHKAIDNLADIGDPWIRLVQVKWRSESLELGFALNVDDGSDPVQTWQVTARNVIGEKIDDSEDEWLHHPGSNHIAVRQFTDEQQDLFFRGSPANSSELIGTLWQQHVATVGAWISFDQYLNQPDDLTDLLSGGFGLLANGPRFLLDAYSAALKNYGLRCNSLSQRRVSIWNGSEHVPVPENLEIIHFGNSYVVAVSFEACQTA